MKAAKKALVTKRKMIVTGVAAITVALLFIWLSIAPEEGKMDGLADNLNSNAGNSKLQQEGSTSVEKGSDQPAGEHSSPPQLTPRVETGAESPSIESDSSRLSNHSRKPISEVKEAEREIVTDSGMGQNETNPESENEAGESETTSPIGNGGKEATVEGLLKTLDEGTANEGGGKQEGAEENDSVESEAAKSNSEGSGKTEESEGSEGEDSRTVGEEAKQEGGGSEPGEDEQKNMGGDSKQEEPENEDVKSVGQNSDFAPDSNSGGQDSETHDKGSNSDDQDSTPGGLESNSDGQDSKIDSQDSKSDGQDSKPDGQDSNSDSQGSKSEGQDSNSDAVESNSVSQDSKSDSQDSKSDSQDSKSGSQDSKSDGQGTNSDDLDSILTSISTNPKEANQSNGADLKWQACPQELQDYVPCIDNKKPRMRLRKAKLDMPSKYERVCPLPEEEVQCLVPLPEGYRQVIKWTQSRDEIWFSNVPHPKLVSSKVTQNWVRQEGDKLTFPGGGTQFVDGADKYAQRLEELVPALQWGVHVKVALDVGCGVASFGAALDKLGVRVQSVAPKDSHEAQVQMALERGLPAVLGYLGTVRLPYPASSFDVVHCARCRITWFGNDGIPLIEANRVLRPGGYFVWSATPIYRDNPKDHEDWTATKALADSLCWNLVGVKQENKSHWGAAIWQKPTSNECYMGRPQGAVPPICTGEDADEAWNVPLRKCIYLVPTEESQQGASWPPPARSPPTGQYRDDERAFRVPYWLVSSNSSAAESGNVPAWKNGTVYYRDSARWLRVVKSMMTEDMGIDWSAVRNVMDCSAVLGGFGAAMEALFEWRLWVMNVVPVSGPDTLPLIFERGLIGAYHDWCEAFSTYPRTYDLLHANYVLGNHKKRCDPTSILVEFDRILRPNGWILVRDTKSTKMLVQTIAASLHWEQKMATSTDREVVFLFQKTFWRPLEISVVE